MNDLRFNEAATSFEAEVNVSDNSFAADFRGVSELKGDKGDPGASAYEIACAGGFEGTEEEWIASLKGDKGASGNDGQSVTHNWNGTVLEVSSASGTSSADLKGEAGYTPQKNVDYFDGTSVSVQSVSESDENGGSNIVTFTDGKTLTIKNGSKGDKGEQGYTPQKDVDYRDGIDGVSATHEWNGTTLTVTSASGTSSADLKGDKGDKGEQGTGVTILGSYETEETLNAAHPTGNIGDSYLVNGSLYIWSETENKWVDVGNIKGEKGEPGYTPVKNVDYFDGQNGNDGKSIFYLAASQSGSEFTTSGIVIDTSGRTKTVGDFVITQNACLYRIAEINGTNILNETVTCTLIANLNGAKGDKGDPATVTVDSALSSGSTNPVQNKVIKAALDSKSETDHNQAASTITAGTLGGKVQANATAAATIGDAQVRNIYAGTADMTEGTSSLAAGTLYLVYE